MIDDLRTYTLVPGKQARNVGVWQTGMGQLDEAVHLWAYRDLGDRAAVRG